MKARKSKISSELASLIKKAAGFHGHLGPFLVIGVRMGSLAKKILNVNAGENNKFRVTARLPLLTPFSCVIDGIQATTQCTVGNQKLRIENSQAKKMV
jgi:formylmethanofuran dehydrogenase subunit E